MNENKEQGLFRGWFRIAVYGLGVAVWVAAAGFFFATRPEPGLDRGAPRSSSTVGSVPSGPAPDARERREERRAMVKALRRYGLENAAVLQAMRRVPRHAFVPAAQQARAYEDSPLPIGHGQTISQPFIVAEMTRLLDLKPEDRVLEIGTGSGYQAAVLAEFTPHVFTVEIIRPLARAAERTLKATGYPSVRVRIDDGYYGWPEHAPFDAIVVTCAAGQIPPPLIEQLASGGRMVIPVGAPGAIQTLTFLKKDEAGRIRSRSLMSVRFVPLVRRSP